MMCGLGIAFIAIRPIFLVGFLVFDQVSFSCQNLTRLVQGVLSDYGWGIQHVARSVNLFLCKEMILRRITFWLELAWA